MIHLSIVSLKDIEGHSITLIDFLHEITCESEGIIIIESQRGTSEIGNQ